MYVTMNNSDFLIIGGGIVGIAVSREIKLRWPDASVVVIEKETTSAEHASGRNSGVLHAGFYYSPDSLKARLTRDGNRILREFCLSHQLTLRECGKVVVASSADQLPALDELYRRGQLNGVHLEIVNERDLQKLEPLARTTEKALWSPATAVASPKDVTTALARDSMRLGVSFHYGTQATSNGDNIVQSGDAKWKAGHVVNCAGLYADVVARSYGFCDDYVMLPFTGLYAYAPSLKGSLTRHVYPVPDARNPFLGVHATVTVDGDVKIGPTAIPAFSREAYRAIRDLNLGELLEIARTYPAFFRSPHHSVSRLIASEVPKYSRSWLVHEARKLVPSLRRRDFSVKGRPGIRAQLFDLRNRRLEMDFVVRGDEPSAPVLNADPPAWTLSIPFAEYVLAGMAERGVRS